MPSSFAVSVKTRIHAPAERVFGLLVDPSSWPTWNPVVPHVELVSSPPEPPVDRQKRNSRHDSRHDRGHPMQPGQMLHFNVHLSIFGQLRRLPYGGLEHVTVVETPAPLPAGSAAALRLSPCPSPSAPCSPASRSAPISPLTGFPSHPIPSLAAAVNSAAASAANSASGTTHRRIYRVIWTHRSIPQSLLRATLINEIDEQLIVPSGPGAAPPLISGKSSISLGGGSVSGGVGGGSGGPLTSECIYTTSATFEGPLAWVAKWLCQEGLEMGLTGWCEGLKRAAEEEEEEEEEAG